MGALEFFREFSRLIVSVKALSQLTASRKLERKLSRSIISTGKEGNGTATTEHRRSDDVIGEVLYHDHKCIGRCQRNHLGPR